MLNFSSLTQRGMYSRDLRLAFAPVKPFPRINALFPLCATGQPKHIASY